GDCFPGFLEADDLLQLRAVLDRPAVDLGDDVTLLDAGFLGGGFVGREILDHDAADIPLAHRLSVLGPHFLDHDADHRALHAAASPRGFPIASAHSPICVESEFPKATVGRFCASILSTAMSVWGSVPTTFAWNTRLSSSRTVTLSAPSTTWLLVRR